MNRLLDKVYRILWPEWWIVLGVGVLGIALLGFAALVVR